MSFDPPVPSSPNETAASAAALPSKARRRLVTLIAISAVLLYNLGRN